jgi:hypothetical protein
MTQHQPEPVTCGHSCGRCQELRERVGKLKIHKRWITTDIVDVLVNKADVLAILDELEKK